MEKTTRCQTCALDPPIPTCAMGIGLPPEFIDIIGLLVDFNSCIVNGIFHLF